MLDSSARVYACSLLGMYRMFRHVQQAVGQSFLSCLRNVEACLRGILTDRAPDALNVHICSFNYITIEYKRQVTSSVSYLNK
jgi:hypothetical protein